MQAYALALRELLPAQARVQSLRATLHFLDPNIEISLADELVDPGVCARAIDQAMQRIIDLEASLDAESFPPQTAGHCRICSYLELCPAGRDWIQRKTFSDYSD